MEHTPEVRSEIANIVESNNIVNVLANLIQFDEGQLELSAVDAARLFEKQRNLIDYAFDKRKELDNAAGALSEKADLFYDAARVLMNEKKRLESHIQYALTRSGMSDAFGFDFKVDLRTRKKAKSFSPPTPEQATKFPNCIEVRTKWKNADPTEDQKRALQIRGLDRDFIETVYEWKTDEAKEILEKDESAFEGRFAYLVSNFLQWSVNKNVSTKRKSVSGSTGKNGRKSAKAIGNADTSGPAENRADNGAPITDCTDGNTAQPVASEM